MLKRYEAIYENVQLKWLSDQLPITSARIIVTVRKETPATVKRRTPSASIAGKGEVLGDIISPIVDEDDWECLK